ncbi:hypothetical protein PHEL85_0841 [Polaribacter sp. Hel1_85]|nr:hypothetical protein PHEL85_0841 [Polaribacter sp. Hel1_85]
MQTMKLETGSVYFMGYEIPKFYKNKFKMEYISLKPTL